MFFLGNIRLFLFVWNGIFFSVLELTGWSILTIRDALRSSCVCLSRQELQMHATMLSTSGLHASPLPTGLFFHFFTMDGYFYELCFSLSWLFSIYIYEWVINLNSRFWMLRPVVCWVSSWHSEWWSQCPGLPCLATFFSGGHATYLNLLSNPRKFITKGC